MKRNNVKTLLSGAIFVMAVLPLTAAFYFLDGVLQTSLDLGFNSRVASALNAASENLKNLKQLDPLSAAHYRLQFEEIEELKTVYGSAELMKRSIRASLTIYFALGVMTVMMLSILMASALNRKIARLYDTTLGELTKHRDKMRYLQEMASWQELAKMLAHEIKNPLTPIEVSVGALHKLFGKASEDEFAEQLDQTVTIVTEEISHLKAIVGKFGEFARLPRVNLTETNLAKQLAQHLEMIETTLEFSRIEVSQKIRAAAHTNEFCAKLDATLFRQVLMNIVRNGIEANPGRVVQFTVQLSEELKYLLVTIANDGVPVEEQIVVDMFEPYVSSKQGKDNMGLGLAVVRMIVLQHGGDIAYRVQQGWPAFVISLPKIAYSIRN